MLETYTKTQMAQKLGISLPTLNKHVEDMILKGMFTVLNIEIWTKRRIYSDQVFTKVKDYIFPC